MIPDRILRAMDTPVIDHRGPEFAKLAKRCLEGIKTIFKTSNPVIIYTATGTGAWEAALVNTLSPGDKVLFVETGQFALQWRQMAQRCCTASQLVGLNTGCNSRVKANSGARTAKPFHPTGWNRQNRTKRRLWWRNG
jgi:aspartate aminotransferase-like enzyme